MSATGEATRSLADFLNENGKIGIEGIDTRALTRHIRVGGAMRGIIATDTDNLSELMDQVQAYPGLNGIDLVKYVTCEKPYRWRDGRRHEIASPAMAAGHYRISCGCPGLRDKI